MPSSAAVATALAADATGRDDTHGGELTRAGEGEQGEEATLEHRKAGRDTRRAEGHAVGSDRDRHTQ